MPRTEAEMMQDPIFHATLDAMQAADEIGGVADTVEYIRLMQAIVTTCRERIETARANYYAQGGAFAVDMEPLPDDAAAWAAVLDKLYDAGGAILYWQMPDDMKQTIELMLDAGAIFSDAESDCLLHPDAEPIDQEGYRTGVAAFHIPHQFQR